ncbi:chromobox protein homolog 1-like [Tribolium madens]|uniref:chromobox protein homolog 1-like n=1 Tax=Tribolium madens TaxID=41895 RepID=UPI001CF740F4|nr:chromobox protein homolog 1-like [Tribolium madens]
MKRKGRKSKKAETDTPNGLSDEKDQNGDASDREEHESEPEEKKRKSNKRKGYSKKAEEETEEEPQYEVEQVLDEKVIRGVHHYLIRWKGYEPESDTWEPESTLNCPELIADFKNKQKKKGKSKAGRKRARDSGKNSSTDETWDENEDFEVDRILDVYFKRNGQREFLVSWKGYPNSQNSWEPEENMDCKDLIKKFMSKVEKAKETEHRELRVNRAHTDRLTLLSDGHLGRRLSKRNLGKQRVHYHDAE